MPAALRPDFDDPSWVLLGYEADGDRFRAAQVGIEELGAAPFMDRRMEQPWQRSVLLPAPDVPRIAMPKGAWLFHTAFCGSTLLARALHAPLSSVSLKEPAALYDLTRLSMAGATAPAVLEARLRQATALLLRPWTAGGAVLVKPTNPVNRLMRQLLAITTDSKAILLYGSLEEFLLSCFKKLPAAETPMRWMMQHLLAGTMLERRLGIPGGHRFNFVECCVLTWYAQIEIYAGALADDHRDRLRTLDMRSMLADPVRAVSACSDWLGLDDRSSRDERAARVQATFARNAKQVGQAYGPDARRIERSDVRKAHGDAVAATVSWARTQVEPYAGAPANWKPLLD